MEKESMDERWKKCVGWWLKWKREKKEYCVYMYGVFIVECILFLLLIIKYVYLKFLFILV